MASASFTWVTKPTGIVQGIKNYVKRLLDRAFRVATTFAKRIEEWAKAHAPWTDQTGEARRRLTARVFHAATAYTITLAHGVYYGIFLELKNQGRFAIIDRAMQAHYGAFMAEIAKVTR